MEQEYITIRVLKQFPSGQKPDSLHQVAMRKGAPADRFWRRRLKDAETDGCCEIVPEQKKGASKSGAASAKE